MPTFRLASTNFAGGCGVQRPDGTHAAQSRPRMPMLRKSFADHEAGLEIPTRSAGVYQTHLGPRLQKPKIGILVSPLQRRSDVDVDMTEQNMGSIW